MTEPRQTDDLTQRYIDASVQDPRRPPGRVRDAVRAHALAVIASKAAAVPADKSALDQPAANQSRWKMSLLASIALAGITGLLVLQFERGTTEQKELALGQAMRRSESAAPVAPATAPVLHAESPPATPQPGPQPPQAKTASKQASAKANPPEVQVNAAAKSTTLRQPSPPPPVMSASELADSSASKAAPPATPQETPAPAPPPAPAMRVAPAAAPFGAARAKASPSQDLNQAMIDAARAGNTAQIESLLQQGAPLNAVDETGKTSLIWAVINNQSTTVQKLLALGANKTIKDQEGLSALQHARRLNMGSMAALLEAGP